MVGIIYKFTSKTSGKSYVGQTWRTFQERLLAHTKVAKRKPKQPFHLAILKYGREDFVGEILCHCSSQEEMDEREDYYILHLNTLSPNGYNLKRGGAKGKHTLESRTKMSLAMKGHKRGIGRVLSEETKRKIGAANRNPSEETRAKLKAAKVNFVPWNKGSTKFSYRSCSNCGQEVKLRETDKRLIQKTVFCSRRCWAQRKR